MPPFADAHNVLLSQSATTTLDVWVMSRQKTIDCILSSFFGPSPLSTPCPKTPHARVSRAPAALIPWLGLRLASVAGRQRLRNDFGTTQQAVDDMAPPKYKVPDGPLDRHDDDYYWNRLFVGRYDGPMVSEMIEDRNDQSGFFGAYNAAQASVIDLHGTLDYDDKALEPHRPSPEARFNIPPNYPAPLSEIPQKHFARARKAVEATFKSMGLTVVKFIGEGGQGYIALCDYTPRKDEPPQRCVVKFAKMQTVLKHLQREIDVSDVSGLPGSILWPN